MSKAIVFDLDETLRSIETSIKSDDDVKVVLRPKLTDLLQKVEEVKQKGVDSIIFTSASNLSYKKYFLDQIPNEYREAFTEIITNDQYVEPKKGTREYYIYRSGNNKVVTALNYDEILFFDDNRTELDFLQQLFDKKIYSNYPVPNKSVTFVSLPFYPRKEVEMFALKELAKKHEDSKVSNKIREYFDLMTQEPGCRIMTELIDEFVSTKHENGLVDINETEEFKEYKNKMSDLYEEIEDIIDYDTNLEYEYRDYEDEYYTQLLEEKKSKSVKDLFDLD
jgi:hypothetical protein